MSKLRKVYVPKWMTWFGLAMLVSMWAWISYRVFLTPGGREDLGVGGWAITTVIMGVVATVLVLMGKRKLPAYLIAAEDEEEGGA